MLKLLKTIIIFCLITSCNNVVINNMNNEHYTLTKCKYYSGTYYIHLPEYKLNLSIYEYSDSKKKKRRKYLLQCQNKFKIEIIDYYKDSIYFIDLCTDIKADDKQNGKTLRPLFYNTVLYYDSIGNIDSIDLKRLRYLRFKRSISIRGVFSRQGGSVPYILK